MLSIYILVYYMDSSCYAPSKGQGMSYSPSISGLQPDAGEESI
jgi:hypothetical protein